MMETAMGQVVRGSRRRPPRPLCWLCRRASSRRARPCPPKATRSDLAIRNPVIGFAPSRTAGIRLTTSVTRSNRPQDRGIPDEDRHLVARRQGPAPRLQAGPAARQALHHQQDQSEVQSAPALNGCTVIDTLRTRLYRAGFLRCGSAWTDPLCAESDRHSIS